MAQINGQAIRLGLAEYLGISVEAAEARMRETILIMQGHYCGRRFSIDGYSLTWFLEEDQIKLVGPDGKVLAATSSQAFIRRQDERRAA
jgi:hypothetical protein